MVTEHIVKSYDQELQRLDNTIVEMGGMAESQLAGAIDAVVKRDSDLAGEVIEGDTKVDELEREVESLVVQAARLAPADGARPAGRSSPRSRPRPISSASAITRPTSPSARSS